MRQLEGLGEIVFGRRCEGQVGGMGCAYRLQPRPIRGAFTQYSCDFALSRKRGRHLLAWERSEKSFALCNYHIIIFHYLWLFTSFSAFTARFKLVHTIRSWKGLESIADLASVG